MPPPHPPSPPGAACRPADDRSGTFWGSRSQVQTLVLMVVTAGGFYLCYRLALPFLSALSWALGLGVLFAPFQGWMEKKFHRRGLAAMVSVLVIAFIVVVPLTFVVQRLVVQAAKGAEVIESKVNSGEWKRSLTVPPPLGGVVDEVNRQLDLPGAVKALATWLMARTGALVTVSVFQAIDFLLTFYLLFFFLRDRREVLKRVKLLSPLTAAQMDRMFSRVGDTIHATIYGTLVVSALQGFLGGLMFWWLGLPAPLTWGLVMALLALVPVLGAFVVWMPAALFLAVQGQWGQALILSIWGFVVVGTVDNLLRPVLVGNRLKLHTVVAFVAVVGGLVQFGPAGLILGPMILAVTTVLLEIWSERGGDGRGEVGRC